MRKFIPVIVSVLVLALVTAACAISAAPTEGPNIATMIAGTMAALSPISPIGTDTPAPTPMPLPSLSPSEIPSPLPLPTLLAPSAVPTQRIVVPPTALIPNATRISFLAGATSAIVTAPIQAGDTQNYVLEAFQGQPMIVNVSSANNDVTLGIKTQGGTNILNISAGQSTWQGSLPQTEDYYLILHGGATTENFTLNIVIPSRITFLPGAELDKVAGKTVGGYAVSYVAFASKGQRMTVDLGNLSNTAALTIWGFTDGQPYVNANMSPTTHFVFTLPATQDYIIQVVPQGGLVVSYTLTVQIR